MAVSLVESLQREFEFESRSTRRLLDLMPTERLSWRPHERSMTLGRLGSHIAEVARYGTLVLETDSLDSEVRTRGPLDLDAADEIVAAFDRNGAGFLASLDGADESRLAQTWQYRKGERVLFEVRRAVALRTFVLNHLVHHRGQLSVYLRLLDLRLPQVYGPTADDRTGY